MSRVSLRERAGGGALRAFALALAVALLALCLCLSTVSAAFGLWSTTTSASRNHFSTLRVGRAYLTGATLSGPGTVLLTWRPSPSASLTTITYEVLRRSGGPYQVVATGLTGTSYTDTLGAPGTYRYRIEADASGFFALSNTRRVTW